jgi:hypothetical protein
MVKKKKDIFIQAYNKKPKRIQEFNETTDLHTYKVWPNYVFFLNIHAFDAKKTDHIPLLVF